MIGNLASRNNQNLTQYLQNMNTTEPQSKSLVPVNQVVQNK